MKLKYFVLVLSLASISYVQAAQRNLCDDLIDGGTSSPEQIKKCLDDKRFGPSDYYKEQDLIKQSKAETAKIEAIAKAEADVKGEAAAKSEIADASKKKDNLEIKKFTTDELFDAGFGKPFYAIRGDYRNHHYQEKRITEGDALCSYLGYEKAITSTVSPELWQNKNGNIKVDKQGLIVDTNILGFASKTPEIYRDEDYKFTVRKYVDITCLKRKDKALNGSKDALKAIVEELPKLLPEELNTPPKGNSDLGVHNGSRSTSSKDQKTPNGYTPPDWAKNSQTMDR